MKAAHKKTREFCLDKSLYGVSLLGMLHWFMVALKVTPPLPQSYHCCDLDAARFCSIIRHHLFFFSSSQEISLARPHFLLLPGSFLHRGLW